MNDDRASVLERMTTALAGSGDVAVMGALGAAQVSPGLIPAAAARALHGVVENGVGGMAMLAAVGKRLTELQARTSQVTYDQARESLQGLVAALNRARRWRLTDRNVRRVAEGSLLMHLHPTCPHCRGRGYELVPGAPTVSERVCQPCGGNGQRPYPKRFREEIAATLSVLGLIQGLTERAVAKEMR